MASRQAFRSLGPLGLLCGLFSLAMLSGSLASNDQEAGGFTGKVSTWEGFERVDFRVDERPAWVVLPKAPAKGLPWIWRAEFFGHRPETDIALLKRGYHLAFIDVGNTFGCPDALKHWDVFYKLFVEEHGFSKKPVLEGLSRGGLYCFNWAASHPNQVGCIYADAPVLDFKSWPAGKGKGKGSPSDWSKLIADYHFASEAEALAYPKNPVDNLEPLAKAKIPLIHVCGDADDVVPIEENTYIVRDRYEKLEGTIKLIVKKGVGHHPHGLDDPTPIVEFILAETVDK